MYSLLHVELDNEHFCKHSSLTFTFHVFTQVIPLRASNLLQTELKKIVFLGNKEYMDREV